MTYTNTNNCLAQIFNDLYYTALDELSGTMLIDGTKNRAQRQLSGVRGTDAVDHHPATRLLRALRQRRLRAWQEIRAAQQPCGWF